MKLLSIFILFIIVIFACGQEKELIVNEEEPRETDIINEQLEPVETEPSTSAALFFSGVIDFGNLPNYGNQVIPTYKNDDNTNGNEIVDEIAVLGRVLFYDKQLSSDNNGVMTTAANDGSVDVNATRSPTLRDLFNTQGKMNGPLMYDGSIETIEQVIVHYNNIPTSGANTNLDKRWSGGRNGNKENLNLDNEEIASITAFIATLSGTSVYTANKWSDPFANIN
jgi:cytochrome c peroxidase